MKFIKIKDLLLVLSSALLLALSFPKFNLQFLAWFAFVPFFLALDGKKLIERCLCGFIFGATFFSIVLYWMFNISVPGMILLVIIMSSYSLIFSVLMPFSYRKKIFSVLIVASIWCVTEFLRSMLFSGFPWALLGYSQHLNIPLIQISDITGVYGVSFIIICVNFCIFRFIKKDKLNKVHAIVTLVLLLVFLFYGHSKVREDEKGSKELGVAVIQGNIPQHLKWDDAFKTRIIDTYANLSKDALKFSPKLIIWPETSVPGILQFEKDMGDSLKALAMKNQTNFLLGTIREENGNYYNSAALLSKEGEIVKNYDKIHLVPFGEYIPFESYFTSLRNSIDKPIGNYSKGRDYTIFRIDVQHTKDFRSSIVKEINFFKFGCLICYEDIFPGLVRQFVLKGASFVVNITNDAWFGKTAAPYQHMQASVFRAVENRVPVIRAANTGVSCFISDKGLIINRVFENGSDIFVEGFCVNRIKVKNKRHSFYTRYGDVFIVFCFIMMLLPFLPRKKVT